MNNTPFVSIIILNYNGKQYLRTTIDSVLAQTYRNFEIIFIDNASIDGSVAFLQTTYKTQIDANRLRILHNKTNTGFARGNNIGYAAASKRSKYVVLLNNDVRAYRTWLAKLVDTAQTYPDIGLVGTNYYDKGRYNNWKRFINKGGELSTITIAGEDALIARRTLHTPHLVELLFASGNGLLVRRSLFRQLFDDEYFAYAEDVYLGWSARLRDIPVVVDMRARMAHEGGGTKKANNKTIRTELTFHGAKNQLMNTLLFYQASNVLKVLPWQLLAHAGRIIDNPRKLRPQLRALWWVICHVGDIRRKRKAIQRTRTVKDRHILPLISGKMLGEQIATEHYNGLYQTTIHVLNWCCLAWCRMTRLPVAELSVKKKK